MDQIDDLTRRIEALLKEGDPLTLSVAKLAPPPPAPQLAKETMVALHAFFMQVVQAPHIRLVGAKCTTGHNSITISGTTDLLSYQEIVADVIFSTDDNGLVCEIEASFSGVHQLPLVTWIKLRKAGFSARLLQPFSIVQFAFFAHLAIRNANLDIHEHLRESLDDVIPIRISELNSSTWQVEMFDGVKIWDRRQPTRLRNVTVEELASLLSGKVIADFLPPVFTQVLQGLVIRDLSASLDFERKRVTDFSLGLEVTNGWPDILPGFSLRPKLELILSLSNPGDPATRHTMGIVRGTLEIKNTDVPVLVRATAAKQTTSWLMGLDPDPGRYKSRSVGVVLPTIADLFSLVSKDAQSLLPDGLRDLPAIKVTAFQVGFTTAPSSLQTLSFVASTTARWTLIHDFLVVENVSLSLKFVRLLPSSPLQIGGSVAGTFAVSNAADFYLQVLKDPASSDWTLSGGLAPSRSFNLTDIVATLLSRFVKLPEHAPQIVFTTASATVVPGQSIYLEAGSTTPWPLLDGLSIDNFTLVFEYRHNTPKNSFTAKLDTTIEVAQVPVDISVALDTSGANGWRFAGATKPGVAIYVSKMVKWVGEKFGDTPRLPEAIEKFKVDKFKLSFESESQDFFFTCEGEVILPGQKSAIQGVITIDIKYQQDKSYTKLFGGSLIIDGMEFDLIFESSHKASGGDSQMFVAAYHDAKGHMVKIDDLIKKVFPTQVPSTGLEISLKDVLFAYQKTSQQSKYLFGLDIEGGLNLSELNLPNLPLIGQPFPAGQTLKLALQVLAAGNNDFTVDEINALNKLNPKGISLPQQEVKKGLKLAALLRVGEETKPLSLPIGLSPQGNGLVEDKAIAVPAAARDQPIVSSANGTQWLTIQKTFGPIHVERVGVGYQTGKIALLLDAALSAAGLTLSLDGLGAEFALTDLMAKAFKPTFHLNGLGIDYRSGPVEIGGSFLKQEGTRTVGGKELPYTSYAGLAVIRTQKLTLSAIGSYAQLNDHPSLFIYAVANYPLGGPAFFYVTGFAAGFGYNRTLTLPEIDAIASFPLVAEAVKDGGPASLPTSQKEQQKTLTDKLQQLEQYLPPSVGDNFIAAGIKFTSFKQIDSFALLVVKFGRRFEIDLLGLSTLTAPPPEAGKTVAPIAEAQLALKASFIPDEGFLGVRAQLTANSYILSKDCHLSGGFAFYSWFEPHRQAGDFVLTLGGYHPKFIVPGHYPQVPRLALNWKVSSELNIKADAYFALTGSSIMAGGHLQATWQSGALRAWFNAGADFILAWKPYHYDLGLYIDMGVSYTFEFFGTRTLTADLGADLHLWGPPFSGTATIHWSIISFAVDFGQGAPQQLEKLKWDAFKTSFLPKPEQICSIAVQQGLMRQMKAEGKKHERWIVNPNEMVLSINSTIPFTHMQFAGADPEEKAKNVAIASMGIESSLTSTCSITITRGTKKKPVGTPIGEDTFQVRPIWKPMPAGLWGKPNLTDDKKYLKLPNLNGAQLVENMLAGFEVRPIKKGQQAHSCHIERDKLQYTTEVVADAYGWQDFQLSAERGESAWDRAAKTVLGKREERDQLVKALGLVNAAIDFGEPVDQGVLLAA